MNNADASASIEAEVRAGSRVLSVFENPLNTRVLRAHAGGPQRLAELQERVGWSAQTTVRAAISNLQQVGALARQTVGGSSFAVATKLTPAGEEMLFVADEVAAWLARCPDGPIPPESEEAKGPVKALAGGWSSTLMRGLATHPVTLSQLNDRIPDVSYPSLERRIAWMRTTGQIKPVERRGRGTPYMVTDWLRQAIAPLGVAGRCERRHLEEQSGPVTEVEVEAAFLLTLPLAPLRETARGVCTLAVQTDPVESDAEKPTLAGVSVEVRQGQILSCAPAIGKASSTWAVGTTENWLDAIIDGRIEDLRIGGADPQLALDLIFGIHFALFIDR